MNFLRKIFLATFVSVVCLGAHAHFALADSPCTTGGTFIGNGPNLANAVNAVNSGNGITSTGGCTPTIAVTVGPSGNLIFTTGALDFSATPTISGLATLLGGATLTSTTAGLVTSDGNGNTVPAITIGKIAATGSTNSQTIQFRSNNGTTDNTCGLSFQSNSNAIFSCALISTGVVQSVGLLNSSYATALRLGNTTAGSCGTVASPLTTATTITSFFGCEVKLAAGVSPVLTFNPAFGTTPPVCTAVEDAASTTPPATVTGQVYPVRTLTTVQFVSTSATDTSTVAFNCLGGK